MCLLLVGIACGGRLFIIKLKAANFWLTIPKEDVAGMTGITMQAFSWKAFYTFLALHGIVLPLLVVIAIIFMWPAFDEFARGGGPAPVSKWSVFEEEEDKTPLDIDDLPGGWGAMTKAASRKANTRDNPDIEV